MTPTSYKFIAILVAVWFLYGCHYMPPRELPVYKYNPIELKYELTHEHSELRYNYFEDEWQFVR